MRERREIERSHAGWVSVNDAACFPDQDYFLPSSPTLAQLWPLLSTRFLRHGVARCRAIMIVPWHFRRTSSRLWPAVTSDEVTSRYQTPGQRSLQNHVTHGYLSAPWPSPLSTVALHLSPAPFSATLVSTHFRHPRHLDLPVRARLPAGGPVACHPRSPRFPSRSAGTFQLRYSS